MAATPATSVSPGSESVAHFNKTESAALASFQALDALVAGGGGGGGGGGTGNFYVDSVAGNDAHDGLTQATAKRALSAITSSLTAGCTLWLARGGSYGYYNTATFPFAVKAYGSGDMPKIDGALLLNNASFAAVGGYANVYSITVSFASLDGAVIATGYNGNYLLQFFDGPAGITSDPSLPCANGYFNATFTWILSGNTHAQNLAYVRDNPGSYCVAVAGVAITPWPPEGTDQVTFFVHLADSSNPISNGRQFFTSSFRGSDIWYQRAGGSIEDVWFSRWSFQHVGYLENCKIDRCRWSGMHRHGPFFNGCVASDCTSYGAYNSGGNFHGYRSTTIEGMGGKNEYYRCYAENGGWGFYSHGGGVVPPQSGAYFEDCIVRNVVMPIAVSTRDRILVKRLKAYDCVTTGQQDTSDYFDSEFHIKMTNATPAPTADAVFNFAAAGSPSVLTNCLIEGGDDDGGARFLWQNCNYGNVTLINTTVDTGATLVNLSTGKVVLVNSIWPGPDATILSATKSYLPTVKLNAGRVHPTNGSITGCFSPKRNLSLGVKPQSMVWVPDTFMLTVSIVITAGSPDVVMTAGYNFNVFTIVPSWKFVDGGFSFAAQPLSHTALSGSTITVTFDRNAPTSHTITGYTIGMVQYYMAAMSAMQFGAGVLAYPDATGDTLTLTGAALDIAQVVVGALIKLTYAGVSLGIFEVTAIPGANRITLDGLSDWRQFFASVNSLDFESYHGALTKTQTPALTVAFPLAAIDSTTLSIAEPSGPTWTVNQWLDVVSGANSAMTKIAQGTPGSGFNANIPALLTDTGSSPWTVATSVVIPDLAAKYQAGPSGRKRLSLDSYLSSLGIGCTL